MICTTAQIIYADLLCILQPSTMRQNTHVKVKIKIESERHIYPRFSPRKQEEKSQLIQIQSKQEIH